MIASRPLTLKEVAVRLRVCKRTVERLIEQGRLRAVRVSMRRRVVLPEDLDAYLAGESATGRDRTRRRGWGG